MAAHAYGSDGRCLRCGFWAGDIRAHWDAFSCHPPHPCGCPHLRAGDVCAAHEAERFQAGNRERAWGRMSEGQLSALGIAALDAGDVVGHVCRGEFALAANAWRNAVAAYARFVVSGEPRIPELIARRTCRVCRRRWITLDDATRCPACSSAHPPGAPSPCPSSPPLPPADTAPRGGPDGAPGGATP